jgi:hypothetical protein
MPRVIGYGEAAGFARLRCSPSPTEPALPRAPWDSARARLQRDTPKQPVHHECFAAIFRMSARSSVPFCPHPRCPEAIFGQKFWER